MLKRIFLMVASAAIFNTQSVHSASYVSRMFSKISANAAANRAYHLMLQKPVLAMTIPFDDRMIRTHGIMNIMMGVMLPTIWMGVSCLGNLYSRGMTKYYQYKLQKKIEEHNELSNSFLPALAKQRSEKLKAAMVGNLVPDLTNIVDQYDQQDNQHLLQAKLAANQVQQNKLRPEMQRHQLTQTRFNLKGNALAAGGVACFSFCTLSFCAGIFALAKDMKLGASYYKDLFLRFKKSAWLDPKLGFSY